MKYLKDKWQKAESVNLLSQKRKRGWSVVLSAKLYGAPDGGELISLLSEKHLSMPASFFSSTNGVAQLNTWSGRAGCRHNKNRRG